MACASPSPHDEVPAVVQHWVRQLLDPDFVSMVREAGERQVEVRLMSSRGRVRRRPALLLDVGPQDMVEPGEAG